MLHFLSKRAKLLEAEQRMIFCDLRWIAFVFLYQCPNGNYIARRDPVPSRNPAATSAATTGMTKKNPGGGVGGGGGPGGGAGGGGGGGGRGGGNYRNDKKKPPRFYE
jgi:uncharacterized membrane protein YgcG